MSNFHLCSNCITTAQCSNLKVCRREATEPDYIDVVFDGKPGPDAPRFVEVENAKGESVGMPWVKRADGYWVIRIAR